MWSYYNDVVDQYSRFTQLQNSFIFDCPAITWNYRTMYYQSFWHSDSSTHFDILLGIKTIIGPVKTGKFEN